MTVRRDVIALLVVSMAFFVGCHSSAASRAQKTFEPLSLRNKLAPSNDREWAPQHAVLPQIEINGDKMRVFNVRNFRYLTDSDHIVDYYDETYRLSDLQSVDFIVTPFDGAPMLAHTMLSFGFRGDKYLVASVEVRLEKDETYSPVLGAMREFEIMYVMADERDVIELRTEIRGNQVFVYRSVATPEQARKLLLDIAARVNDLHDNPEFYDTLTNNCTTNIVRHINDINPGAVPYDYKILLPGLSPQLAYDLGLLDSRLSFDELQKRADVTELAHRYHGKRDFSRRIRQ